MPISDEVIELAPVKKTKKQLIILLAVIGVSVALAVTFLILYLLKPNVDENPIVVNAVTVTGNDLYAQTEGDDVKYYASIGNEYTVYANISVEKETSPMLKWEVVPAGAVTVVESTELATTDEETGETKNAYFKFVPSGAHDTDVAIKVRSAADVNKSAEFNFTIVNAVAHSIVAKQYQPNGGTAVDIQNNTINIPYYKTNTLNNKIYYMIFEQFGRKNETTGEYLPMTGDSASHLVSVSSSDERVVSVQYPNANSFSFKAEGKTGSAVITITANVNNVGKPSDAPADPVTCQVTINVEDNITLGYIENIYFFDRGVVDGAFIESILDATRNRIDQNKLTAKVRADGLKMNEEFVMPYNSSYTDIFSHILIAPVDIQYDIEERELLTDWHSKISVTATGDALNVGSLNGTVTLRADSLASSANGANACKMTLTDNTPGGLRSKVDVNVNIVAQNTTGTVGVTIGTGTSSTTYREGQAVAIAPEGEATFTAVYTHKMPGRTDPDTVLERKYINSAFMLDFDPAVLEVHIAGINDALKPQEKYNLTSNAISIEEQGTTTASARDFLTTVTLSVKVKSNAAGGPSALKFIKIGSALTATEDWENECTWEKSMTFNVTRRATSPYFKNDAEATAIVTNNGTRLARFQVTNDARTNAVLYVQNMTAGQRFDQLFNILDLADADATFTAEVTSINLGTNSAFNRVASQQNNPEYNKLLFRGDPDCSASDEQAFVTITVSAAGGVALATKLTVSIHVFDAVSEFVTVEPKLEYYEGINPTNSSIVIRSNNSDRSDIKITRVLADSAAPYAITNDNIQLYLGSTTEPSARLLKVERNSTMYFNHGGTVGEDGTVQGGTELFSYSRSTGQLTPQTDLYAYAYRYNSGNDGAPIDVSNVLFEVTLNSGEFYTGEEAPALTIGCSFVRRANGLAVFTDESCDTKIEGSYDINQGDQVTLYVSSLVEIAGVDDPIIVNKYKYSVETVQRSYLTLSPDLNGAATSDSAGKVSGTNDRYYYVTIKAPNVTDTSDNIDDYTIQLGGGATGVAITFNVQNFARPVSGIYICSDENGNTPISEDVLSFGEFINGNIFRKTIYIKVEYVAANDSYMYYESVLLSLPKYLTVNNITSQNITVTDEPSVTYERYTNQSNRVIYKITPTRQGVTDDNNARIFRCELELTEDAQSLDSTLVLQPSTTTTGTNLVASKDISIGTGLSDIKVSKTGNEADWSNIPADPSDTTDYDFVTVEHTFALKNDKASENNTLVLYLNFNVLTKEHYSGIKYDLNKLEVSLPTVAGLSFDTTGLNTATPNIKVAIDKNALQTLDGIYSLTFTDTANGATADNVFTLKLHLTVTMDIYKLAFGNEGSEFEISTTDTAGSNQSVTVQVVYNEGKAAIQPAQSLINGVDVVSIVKRNADNSYSSYNGNDVWIDRILSGERITYTLRVSDTIMSGNDFYVCLGHGTLQPVYRHIAIQTKSHRIELDRGNGIVSVENNAAVIEINALGQQFSLPVKVINKGTNEKVDRLGSGQKVVYGIYASDSDYTDGGKSPFFTIDGNGVITVGSLTAVSGTVYYRAVYTDDNVAGDTMDICVAITYKLAVTNVTLAGIDGETWKDNKLTLYYKDGSNYTSLDLGSYINVSNAFGIGYSDKLEIKLTSDSTDHLAIDSANKTLLLPKRATDDGGITFEISVGYDKTTVCTKQFSVVVKGIDGLALDSTSGIIDVFENSTLTVTPVFSAYSGLNADYSLTAPNNGNLKVVKSTGDVYTVGIDDRQSATHGSSYSLTATLEYTPKDGSSLDLVGTLSYTAAYTVNIGGEYEPEFTIKAGETAVSTKGHIIGNSAYTLTIDNSHGYTGATYQAEAENVVTFTGDDSSNIKNITFKANESGTVYISVTVNAYGKSFGNTVAYEFLRGAEASAELYAGNTQEKVVDNASIELNYTVSAPTYEYRIANLGDGVANVVVSGVAEGDIDRTAQDKVVITVNKPTTITVGGTVTVGGTRTIYLTPYTVTFTATEPEFELTANAETVLAGGTVTFSVNGTGRTVVYEVVDGGATIDSTGVLTAASALTSDRKVTVKATVTVDSGAYRGTKYTYFKTITVLGVPLPTIGWKQSEKTVKVGDVDLSSLYEKVETVSVSDGSTHTYTLSVSVDSSATGLVKNTDYTISGNTLRIIATDKTRAGGKITLTVAAKVTSAINNDSAAVVRQSSIDIVIEPQAKAVSGVILGNAAGTYDISGVATVYYTATSGDFVSSDVASNSKVVALSLASGVDTSKFAVSGSTITLKQNIDTETTVGLTATVEIVGGVYDGTQVSCNTSVTVKVASIKGGVSGNVAWSEDKYDSVSNIASRIDIPEPSATVSSINIVASNDNADDDKYSSVTNNNSATPSISFDRDSNFVPGATAGARKQMKFTYIITLDNGHMYVLADTFALESVPVTITTYLDNEIFTDDTIYRTAGDSFVIRYAANNGFAVGINSVTVTDSANAPSTALTATFGGERIMFGAAQATTGLKVAVAYVIGGTEYVRNYTVNIAALSSNAAYVTDNNSQTVAVGDSGTVSSTWTSQSDSGFNYPGNLTVSVSSGNLRTYVNSIAVSSNGVDLGTVTLDNGSFTFPRSGYYRDARDSFVLEISYKTSSAQTCNLNVSLVTYNGRGSYASSQTMNVSYSFAVIADMTVTFDTGVSGITSEPITVSYNGYYSNLPNPTRNGYDFNGWFTASGAPVNASTKVSATSAHTLYAHWTAKHVDVQFDSVGGSDVDSRNLIFDGAYGNLPTPTKAGYRFDGWYTQASGGDRVFENTVVKTATQHTLYAHWTANLVTVTYYDDNGTVLSTKAAAIGDSYSTLLSYKPTKYGYKFDGWYTAASGGDKYTASGSVTADTQMYAHWTANTYAVSYNANYEGAAAITATTDVTFGRAYGTLATAPTRTGYTFAGWWTAQEGGARVEAETTVSSDSAHTLYAHWTLSSVTVTLYRNDGTDAVVYTATVDYDSSFDLHTVIIPTREGYSFAGWYADADDTATKYTGAISNVTADMSMYAHWTGNTITVSYDLNYDGAEAIDGKTVTVGGTYGELVVPTERAGFTFDGWFTAAENGQRVQASDTVTSTVNHALYAHWTETPVTPAPETPEVTE